jgi:hypothetical protein
MARFSAFWLLPEGRTLTFDVNSIVSRCRGRDDEKYCIDAAAVSDKMSVAGRDLQRVARAQAEYPLAELNL